MKKNRQRAAPGRRSPAQQVPARESPAPQNGTARPGLTSIDGGRATLLEVRAQPGAKRAGFGGFWNGLPRIAVGAPPEDGRANAEIALAIAALFDLRASAVELVGGATSRVKRFRLACAPAIVAARLRELESREDERARIDARIGGRS